MSDEQSTRWGSLDCLVGFRVVKDDEMGDVVRTEYTRRCHRLSIDIPYGKTCTLSKRDRDRYRGLNDQLHEKMEAATRQHFAGIPIPKILVHGCGRPTPFTYQNRDWFGPSFECYLVVWEDEVSSGLLGEMQSVLHGDHRDWCVVVCTTQRPDFDTNHELRVYSDEVLVPESALQDLKVGRQ